MNEKLPTTSFDLEALLAQVTDIAEETAAGICRIYRRDFQVDYKDDRSPLTEADLFAHKMIKARLAGVKPHLPMLSEESADIAFAERGNWESYWLVDPLDGTHEFVKKRDDFTVNIALIHQQRPILGVVYVPIEETCYVATATGEARKRTAQGTERIIRTRNKVDGVPVIAVSFSHADTATGTFLKKIGRHHLVRRGSLLKCCLIAEGKVDLYPRFGKTCEWDTAAGQCILEKAGGTLVDFSGKPLRYNTKESLVNPPFIACGPAAPDWQACI